MRCRPGRFLFDYALCFADAGEQKHRPDQQTDGGRTADDEDLFALVSHNGNPLFENAVLPFPVFRPLFKGDGRKIFDFFLRIACLFSVGMIE